MENEKLEMKKLAEKLNIRYDGIQIGPKNSLFHQFTDPICDNSTFVVEFDDAVEELTKRRHEFLSRRNT